MSRNGILFLSLILLAGGKYYSGRMAALSAAQEGEAISGRWPASTAPVPSAETLQQECLQAKPEKCFDAGWKFGDQIDTLPLIATIRRAALQAKASFFWRKGCAASEHSACDSLLFFGNRQDKDFAEMQLKLHCAQGAQGSCTVLAHWLIGKPGSKNAGEAILAHQCRHRDDDACEDLGGIQVKSAETIKQGVALLNQSCENGRVSACGLLISMYAIIHPEFSNSLIKKVEIACSSARAISACEYLVGLYSGENDPRIQNLERALEYNKKLCDYGVSRNCQMAEALAHPKSQQAARL